jgi:hypothetical protein
VWLVILLADEHIPWMQVRRTLEGCHRGERAKMLAMLRARGLCTAAMEQDEAQPLEAWERMTGGGWRFERHQVKLRD